MNDGVGAMVGGSGFPGPWKRASVILQIYTSHISLSETSLSLFQGK